MSNVDRIECAINKFGNRIKKFKLWNSIQSESSDISVSQLTRILKAIPEVEELTLCNLFSSESDESTEELELHKLKRLKIDDCMFESTSFLNRIPVDVLHDFVFTFESPDKTHLQSFFDRQTKIKKLEIFENDEINFDHLELEHLKISSDVDFAKMISQQPKLRYLDFAISWIDDKVFSALCNLTNLQVLKTLIDLVSCHAFKQLKELTSLKELRIDSHDSFECGHLLELSMMKCTRLEKLTLLCSEREISEEILIQISNNLRNLKHIEIMNRSIKRISTIIEYFPRLETLLLDFFSVFGAPEDVLIISEELKHDNLQQLVITNVIVNIQENTKSLLKLVQACPNLRRIMMSHLADFTKEDLKQILNTHKSLTHLSLELDDFNFDYDVIDMIKNSGRSLVYLRLNRLSSFPSYETLRTLFYEMFSNITLYQYSTNHGNLVMKKKNDPDWYLNFNLMNHF